VRLAALVAWCEGLVRRSYTSRSEAVAARADAAEWLGKELNHAAANNLVLCATIENLQNAIAQYLTELIVDLAPSVRGNTAISAAAGDSTPIPFVRLISRRPMPEGQPVSGFCGGGPSEDVTVPGLNWRSSAAG
jgi:hypothetical protein